MHATARVASLFRVASSLRWLSHPIYLGSTQLTPKLNIPKPSMGTLDEIFDQRDLNKFESERCPAAAAFTAAFLMCGADQNDIGT
jgi:hypothetical protein